MIVVGVPADYVKYCVLGFIDSSQSFLFKYIWSNMKNGLMLIWSWWSNMYMIWVKKIYHVCGILLVESKHLPVACLVIIYWGHDTKSVSSQALRNQLGSQMDAFNPYTLEMLNYC